jgi:hypothetical protein
MKRGAVRIADAKGMTVAEFAGRVFRDTLDRPVIERTSIECLFDNPPRILPLRANISETFLTAQNREQGEKEMNHDRWSKIGSCDGSGSDAESQAAQFHGSI